MHDPHVPMRLKSEKHDHVPSLAPDYTVSILDRLFDLLGWLTGVKVPVLMGVGRETCWYTVQLENAAALEFIYCGVTVWSYGKEYWGR